MKKIPLRALGAAAPPNPGVAGPEDACLPGSGRFELPAQFLAESKHFKFGLLAEADFRDDMTGYRLLKAHAPSAEFLEYIEAANRDPEFGMPMGGFYEDYYQMASILMMKPGLEFTVVDVGCASAFQHVFFRDCAGYVGIDGHLASRARVFTGNARLLQGDFADLVESGAFEIRDDMIGIANMSILYGSDPERERRNIDSFNRFRRKIIL